MEIKNLLKKKNLKNNLEAIPNQYLQPLNYKNWEMIGAIFAEHERFTKQTPKKRFLSNYWKRYRTSIAGLIGLFTFLVLVITSLIIPLTTVDPKKTDVTNNYLGFMTNGHVFGTDNLGRDLWARLWYGLRFSLGIAFAVTLMDLLFGLTLGLIMGYSKRFDALMQSIIKVISNVPAILIMIIAMIAFKPSFWILVLSLTLTGWISMAQQIRAQVKRASTFEWVNASKLLGTPTYKIIFNFIPVTIPIVITQLVFTIPSAIIAETSLAFIGLSIPNQSTLGTLIFDGSKIITLFPRYTLVPVFFLITLTTAIQLIGNATQNVIRRQR